MRIDVYKRQVKGGYELVTNGVEYEGAYRAKDKDLLRALAPVSYTPLE